MPRENLVTLTSEILKIAQEKIASSTIGFVQITTLNLVEDAELRGSGTLCHVDDKYFIVTAQHVISKIVKNKEIGLIFCKIGRSKPSRITIKTDYCDIISYGPGESEHSGPDIGVIILPIIEARRIERFGIFYNLNKRKDGMLSDVNETRNRIWKLGGLVGERTSPATPKRRLVRTKIFGGIVADIEVKRIFSEEKFDYIDCEVLYDENYVGPHSFGGCSGGGLWQVLFAFESGGIVNIDDVILSGVVFCQFGIKDEKRVIRSHGCKSIYRNIVDVVASKQ